MRPWAQIPSIILATIGFVLAMWPRTYSENHTHGEPFRMVMWPKLLKFPFFWLGVGLLGLILIQALNPAWEYKTNGTVFWMQSLPHQPSLPAGVRAPFAQWNPWRMMVVYGSCWLVVCTAWVGLTRRRSLHQLLAVIAFNGLALASLGVAQLLFGNGKMFWSWVSPNPQFFATFIYKNHGGAYLVMTLAVCWGLAGLYYIRGLRRMQKSDPSVVIAFLALCIGAAIFVSQSRGATLVMLAFMMLMFGAFAVHQFLLPRESRRPLVTVLLLAVFALSIQPALTTLGSRQALERLKHGLDGKEPALLWRELVTDGALEMLGENWKRGVGAGAFRFLFPIYQHRHKALMVRFGKPVYWEHAHNDIVQFPIELGIAGASLIVLAIGYFVFVSAWHRFWRDPMCVSVTAILLLLIAYAWYDFPFQNPAVLITWWSLATVVMSLARMRTAGGD